MARLEIIEYFLKDLIASLQVAKIYTVEHPRFSDSIDKSFKGLRDILEHREELAIGIIGEEIACGEEVFFELSKKVKSTSVYLRERGIERIIFSRGLQKEELVKFITFLITPQALQSPQGVKNDAQKHLAFMGIRNIAVGKIKVSISTPGFASEEEAGKPVSYLSRYEDSLDKISESLERVADEGVLDCLELKFTVVNIMDDLMSNYQEFLKLATTMKRYDSITFTHLLNVSILSMFFSSKMGFSKDDVLDVGIAALFHDIGKLYISRKIIQKPDKLSENEFGLIMSHTTCGAEILLKYVDSLGISPVVVAFEHHLGYDLGGYPKVFFSKPPHIISLIVSICDNYDALSQRRSYKRDYSPQMIYDLMIRKKGSTFDPHLLEKFFKIMGVWPVGAIVLLSDDRVAVVREENEDDIFSPKVEVIHPASSKGLVDLKDKKEEIRIDRYLNPLGKGKKYLHLI
ncbi:MAG: HD domain-containing protein [Candidatus Omnitrophica bacterium]|nr:HD domain-containing protein [Candidatus Omnitrophota bacterium]